MYALITSSDGVFRIERIYASFAEARDAWRDGQLLVSEPVARMIEGRAVTSHDTPNFQHFNADGSLVWFREPEEYAKLVFRAVSGVDIPDFAAAKHPAGARVGEIDVFTGREGDEVTIAAYNERTTCAMRVRVRPQSYHVEWWNEDELRSSPPLILPDQEFFRRYLS